jgi:hypothetical protein
VLNLQKPEDWYSVKQLDIWEEGGKSISDRYGSFMKALQWVYPEYNWCIWRFDSVHTGFWNSDQNVLGYLRWVEDQLNLTTKQEWSEVTTEQINRLKGSFLLKKYGGLANLLQKYISSPLRSKSAQFFAMQSTVLKQSKSQTHLLKKLQELFPHFEITTNYRHPELVFSESNSKMELDIFIPATNLAFEYQVCQQEIANSFLQGEQHFAWHFKFGSPKQQKEHDQQKREACQQAGISLVEVPYWWDLSASSLVLFIKTCRPDLSFASLDAQDSN